MGRGGGVLTSETGPALQEFAYWLLPLCFPRLLLISERRPPLALLVAVRIKAVCENIHTFVD